MFGRRRKLTVVPPPTDLDIVREHLTAIIDAGDKRLDAVLARLRAKLAEHQPPPADAP